MMLDKLSLKRLTASDLTFFEWHFKNGSASNQKAINLNADVFIDQLYPTLEAAVRGQQNKLGVDLWIAGPNAAEPINLQRKIIKGAAYKNWRLDGEFVYNPDNMIDRFNILQAGDIALIGFDGELAPATVTLILLANLAPEDRALYDRLSEHLGDRRMTALSDSTLRELCNAISVPETHPVWPIICGEDVAEAALGRAPAVSRLLTRRRPMKFTLEDLRKARQAAEEVGRLGEELVNVYLEKLLAEEEVGDYEWVSDENAIAPYDFRVQRSQSWEKLEVKTTRGNFVREFHLPFSELKEMVYGREAYRIARVYQTTPEGAKMRISEEFQAYGRSIIYAFDSLPDGVTPDGVTIVPDEAMFGDEISLSAPVENEDC